MGRWSVALLAAALTSEALASRNSSILARRGVDGLPGSGNCIYTNDVAFGVVPSDGPYSGVSSQTYSISNIDSLLGGKVCAYGKYSQVTDSSYSNAKNQLTSSIVSEAKNSGGVFQASIMPTLNPITSFSSGTAQAVANVMEQFTNEGIEVWLRFGHEMNWYFNSQSGPTYHCPNGASACGSEFIDAWKLMYNAVQGNDLIKMWWSPNQDNNGDYDQYWPGSEYVDLVGIDCYPGGTITDSSFGDCYQEFYDKYATAEIPFAIGETGYCGSSGNDAWLSQLLGLNMENWPNYIAMSWFEFITDVGGNTCDFRVIENSNLLGETKKILFDGAAGTSGGGSGGSGSGSGGSGSGGSGSSNYPTDTCTWGCEGWDCSSSSPCQSAYTCSNGVCGDCTWGCNGWDCDANTPCNADYTCVSGYCHHSGPATGSGGSSSGGGGISSGGGGSSSSNYPADTCSWGCEGWDCSSSSPCQSAYTCNNGICGSCSWGCNGWNCNANSPCNADYTCVSGICHHSGPAT